MLSEMFEQIAAVKIESGTLAEGFALLEINLVRLVRRGGLHRNEVRGGWIPLPDSNRAAGVSLSRGVL